MQISNAFGEALREVNPRHPPLVDDALRAARQSGGPHGLGVRYLLDERGWPYEVRVERGGDVVEVIARRDEPMEPPPEERIPKRSHERTFDLVDIEQLELSVDRLRLMGIQVQAIADDEPGKSMLVITGTVPERETGASVRIESLRRVDRHAPLHLHLSEIQKAFLSLLQHEFEEQFTVNKVALLDPHFISPEALALIQRGLEQGP